MARRILALVLALLAVCALSSPARAAFEATDPDDAPHESPFDISRVRSDVTESGNVVVHVHFYEVPDWAKGGARIKFDSQGDEGEDFGLEIRQARGGRNLRCLLGDRSDLNPHTDVGSASWPRGFTCWLKRSLLHPTHRIRWRAYAFYIPPPCECQVVYDRAPGHKDWYPIR